MGFIEGGEVFVTGRSKDLIIIHGRNIFPQDVEAAVENVVEFRNANSCAAIGFELAGQERLAIVAEADRALTRLARAAAGRNSEAATASSELDAIVGKIRQRISEEFELSVHAIAFVRPGSFPRTSSGKVQRRTCRDELLAGSLDLVYIWRETGAPSLAPCHASGRRGEDNIRQCTRLDYR